MIKKSIAIILSALCVVFSAAPALALDTADGISVKLNSDIAGLTKNDAERLMEIGCGCVAYNTRGDGPIFISDYAGTAFDGALTAGRTYYVYYSLVAREGYTLPERLDENNLNIECGKGVTVISSNIVSADIYDDDGSFETFRGIQIFAKVTVDGNAIQRIVGLFRDLILKIRAWSLY